MKVVIFSGTTEGRELSWALADMGAKVLVCVATEYGKIDQGTHSGVKVHSGRMEQADMEALLDRNTLCIDATHPYAIKVTDNIRRAAKAAGAPYQRLLRPASPLPEHCVAVQDAAEAVRFLQQTQGNILLTTGAKELSVFRPLGAQRLYARVLPLPSSLEACAQAGILPARIIAMQGPFGVELNVALLRQFHIQYLVTKDGGGPGGFQEKWEAARACHIQMVVLRRPQEEGSSFEAVFKFCKEWLAGCR